MLDTVQDLKANNGFHNKNAEADPHLYSSTASAMAFRPQCFWCHVDAHELLIALHERHKSLCASYIVAL